MARRGRKNRQAEKSKKRRKARVRVRRRERRGDALQELMAFPLSHGGKRPGAGRKPKGQRAGVRHERRPDHLERHPVLVTTRLLPGRPSLRGRRELRAFEACLCRVAEREDFRVVHFSIQRNHVHLLVEAADKDALSNGMNGLLSGLGRRLNRIWQSQGRVFDGRYHACPKTTPRQVQRALAYVLRNGVKHGVVRTGCFDPASSVQAFLGATREALSRIDLDWLAAPTTWLLSVGWRRAGTITRRDLTTSPA